jgi:hypothetical protein
VRRVAFGVVGSRPLASGFLFELVEQVIQILLVEHQTAAMALGHQERPPNFIERATFDADIGHGLLV